MIQNRLHTMLLEGSLGRFSDYSNKRLIDALHQKQKPLC